MADLVLLIGVDVRVEDCETIEVADVGRNPSQVFNLLLVGNALLKDGFSLAFELAEHEEHELIQVLYF